MIRWTLFFWMLLTICNVNAWEIRNVNSNTGKVFVAVDIQENWAATFTSSAPDATFCFEGPYSVVKGETYTVKIKVGTGKWFDAPFSALDSESLCTFESKKATGLFGSLVSHGSFSFGIESDGGFLSTTFYGSDLKSRLGW